MIDLTDTSQCCACGEAVTAGGRRPLQLGDFTLMLCLTCAENRLFAARLARERGRELLRTVTGLFDIAEKLEELD